MSDPTRMHTCPRPGCRRRIHRRLFACRDDWYALSPGVRAAIRDTVRQPFTRERLAAVRAALEDWRVAS